MTTIVTVAIEVLNDSLISEIDDLLHDYLTEDIQGVCFDVDDLEYLGIRYQSEEEYYSKLGEVVK